MRAAKARANIKKTQKEELPPAEEQVVAEATTTVDQEKPDEGPVAEPVSRVAQHGRLARMRRATRKDTITYTPRVVNLVTEGEDAPYYCDGDGNPVSTRVRDDGIVVVRVAVCMGLVGDLNGPCYQRVNYSLGLTMHQEDIDKILKPPSEQLACDKCEEMLKRRFLGGRDSDGELCYSWFKNDEQTRDCLTRVKEHYSGFEPWRYHPQMIKIAEESNTDRYPAGIVYGWVVKEVPIKLFRLGRFYLRAVMRMNERLTMEEDDMYGLMGEHGRLQLGDELLEITRTPNVSYKNKIKQITELLEDFKRREGAGHI